MIPSGSTTRRTTHGWATLVEANSARPSVAANIRRPPAHYTLKVEAITCKAATSPATFPRKCVPNRSCPALSSVGGLWLHCTSSTKNLIQNRNGMSVQKQKIDWSQVPETQLSSALWPENFTRNRNSKIVDSLTALAHSAHFAQPDQVHDRCTTPTRAPTRGGNPPQKKVLSVRPRSKNERSTGPRGPRRNDHLWPSCVKPACCLS